MLERYYREVANFLLRRRLRPSPSPAPQSKVELSAQTEYLLHRLQQLPRRRREAFVLHRFYGLAYTEIAQHMRISSNQVEQHIRIAMQACRQELKAYHSTKPSLRRAGSAS